MTSSHSSLYALRTRIERKESRIAVIGLGYVGLPVACQFAEAGFDVIGIELRGERVDKINQGTSPIEGDEPGLADLLERVIGGGKLRASDNYQHLSDRDVILIDVETPVDERHQPAYEALRSVLCSLGPVMKEGTLVIVESTIAPGTMDGLVRSLLEETSGKRLNEGFYLGNCPERVMPGKLLYNLTRLSRVLGGMTPETAETMQTLYAQVVQAELDLTDCVTAELVKTTENAYRDVQIAFANEVAQICEAVGGDVWKVRELVNKSPFRNMHLPGAGVGGHCIPKDPWLLAYGVREKDVTLKLIPAARAVNDSMPVHMIDLLSDTLNSLGHSLAGAHILILGYSYLENSDDTRNSPSEQLVSTLEMQGTKVVIHDPFVPAFKGNVYELAQDCSAAVLMVKHSEYQSLDFQALQQVLKLPVLIDGRGMFQFQPPSGYVYRCLGVGA